MGSGLRPYDSFDPNYSPTPNTVTQSSRGSGLPQFGPQQPARRAPAWSGSSESQRRARGWCCRVARSDLARSRSPFSFRFLLPGDRPAQVRSRAQAVKGSASPAPGDQRGRLSRGRGSRWRAPAPRAPTAPALGHCRYALRSRRFPLQRVCSSAGPPDARALTSGPASAICSRNRVSDILICPSTEGTRCRMGARANKPTRARADGHANARPEAGASEASRCFGSHHGNSRRSLLTAPSLRVTATCNVREAALSFRGNREE